MRTWLETDEQICGIGGIVGRGGHKIVLIFNLCTLGWPLLANLYAFPYKAHTFEKHP